MISHAESSKPAQFTNTPADTQILGCDVFASAKQNYAEIYADKFSLKLVIVHLQNFSLN